MNVLRCCFVVASSFALAACGGDDAAPAGGSGGGGGSGGASGSGGGAGAASTCDAAGVAACAVDQMQCHDDGSGPECSACAVGQYAAPSGVCTPIPGTVHEHEFAEFTVGTGEEVLGLCQSWTLGNEEEIWFNAIELEQNEQSHHSNWMFVPEDKFDGPDGVWSCKDRSYSQLQAALFGGVLYAQSTQASKEVQKFPDGAAVRIPPRSRIIGDVHLLNTTPQDVTGRVVIRIYGIPVSDVTVRLAPFHLDYHELAIPARAVSRFTGECDIDTSHRDITGRPFDGKIYYILPHTHALGSRYFLEVLGGPNDGQSIIDVTGFNGEARGRRYDPPLDMTGATGFRFGCEFDNPRDESIGWGFGDQEMCENLGFMEADIAFESRVSEAVPGGTDGSIQLFSGACATQAFDWSLKNEGGGS